jgi:hypothetical protein
MKHQGKIKAIPVKEVTEGMQVLWNPWSVAGAEFTVDNIYKISKKLASNTSVNVIRIHDGYTYDAVLVEQLEILVVEYESYEQTWPQSGRDAGGFEQHGNVTKQIPLKYSQWQSAIDNNEVNSDKTVEFEIIEMGLYDQVNYAKIIPQKKRMYTSEEVELLICSYAAQMAHSGIIEPTLHLDVKKWFEYKKNTKT